ncbi:MAG: hypothetical protein K0S65_4790, partial [Labilithrix sp.]|nr:hypothetical protein [Labilithrix sp.]
MFAQLAGNAHEVFVTGGSVIVGYGFTATRSSEAKYNASFALTTKCERRAAEAARRCKSTPCIEHEADLRCSLLDDFDLESRCDV